MHRRGSLDRIWPRANRQPQARARGSKRFAPRACLGLLVCAGALAVHAGCVERTLKIRTSPPGAVVYVNDEDVGVSPARVAFTWYGDYEIQLRKSGYQTLSTNYRAEPPWFQWPVIDLVCETLVPGTLRDEHEPPVYELTPTVTPAVEELLERAEQTRVRALSPPPQ